MKIKNYDIGICKSKGIFGFHLYNAKLHILDSYFIHYSLVDPWWFPNIKHNQYINKEKPTNSDWLCGWFFLYVGNMHYETDGKGNIKGKEGGE